VFFASAYICEQTVVYEHQQILRLQEQPHFAARKEKQHNF